MTAPNRKPITGKVAQILNERQLVINIGEDEGVEVGMRFDVLAESPISITDPDDESRVLGTYDRPKVKVEAFEVEKQMSICQTFESVTTPGNIWWQMQNSLVFSGLEVEPVPPTTSYANLRASDDEYPAPLTPSESYVKRGDRVREIETRSTEGSPS